MGIKPINKGRIVAVDFLKFFAALLITNSHMEICYPDRLNYLSTGGSIGDALFFISSGFTLFLKPLNGIAQFPNWYKRRINRIYPSVFAAAIIGSLFFGRRSEIIDIIFHCGWFISCIMCYYVVIYFIGSYGRDKIFYIIYLVLIATGIWFFCINKESNFSMYQLEKSNICLLFYFIFMLLGAKVGLDNQKVKSVKTWVDILLLFVSIVAYYSFLYIGTIKSGLLFFQLLSLIPLIFVVYYLFKVMKSAWAEKIYYNKTIHFVVRFIGGLCLEIYLVQGMVITNRLNSIFPLNILVIFIGIFLLGYLTRCLARLLSQTFNESPYNWKKIIEKY